LEPALEAYREILVAQKSDKIYAGLPKYTSKKEISSDVLKFNEFEDRALLSFVLQPGEYVGPVGIQQPDSPWHMTYPDNIDRTIIEEIKQALYDLSVVYYRPYDFFPALRIEIAKAIRSNKGRLGVLIEAVKMQCAAAGILEPYPLYLADRMVKHLGTALPAMRKTATQEMALKWEGTLGNMFLAMSSYRTEWGK
jgi:hypothetical protein